MIYAICTNFYKIFVQNYESMIYMLITVDYLKKR